MKTYPGFKIFILTIIITLLLCSISFAAINFPYADASLTYPAPENPYIGYGSMHSCLASSVSTALWNPAGLTKIPSGEISVLLGQKSTSSLNTSSNNVEEVTYNVLSEDSGFKAYIFYSHTDLTTPGTEEVISTGRYKSNNVDVTYGQAIKFNDYFTLAMATRGNTAAELNINGQFPITSRFNLNLYGVDNYMDAGISVDNNGLLTISSESYSYTTTNPLWAGFLNQNATTPATAYLEASNNVSINSDLIISAATQTGPISWGFNAIPISASSVINNVAQVIIEDDAAEVIFYSPDVNTSDEAAVLLWSSDPDFYGSENGYKSEAIDVPPGEIVADVVYAGTYNGSTMRVDFGATYDLDDLLTISVAAENVNGATLSMKGEGLIAYGTHRLNTAETPSLTSTAGLNWSPITDYQQAIPDCEDWDLAGDKTYTLPKRMRYGIALRKPFLISLDYEQQLNPIEYNSEQSGTYTTTKISNINILRLGMESQFLILPIWFRSSMALLFKPNVENNPDLKASVDSAYETFPVYPVMSDFGGNIRIYDTDIGLGLGFNALTALSLVQLDTVNNNLSQFLYYSGYISRGPWQITYTQALDPIYTASAYLENHSIDDFNNGNYEYADLKWISTLAFTYRF